MSIKLSLNALIVVAGAGLAGCDNPAAPLGPCEPSSAAFSSAPPQLDAVVSSIDYNNGIAPGGSRMSEYVLELHVASGPADLFVKSKVPVFLRHPSGRIEPVTACSIAVGDRLEVLHDSSIGYSSDGVSPPVPSYQGTQVVIIR